jgi:transcriptional regulator with PAS, ATPase and Fis domain
VVVLGDAPAFRKAIDLAKRVAPTDASVFITGDSGTGKELVAQLIHQLSRRSSRELVALNCAALPEGLLESEMFGHAKGAFTGAVQDKPGLLEAANGGTLFLDELTEMSLAIQAKLLRAIQDGVVRRVGSTTTSALVNVRFVAATNRDPHEAMKEGELRKDLYYRLRVVPIHLPRLRERPGDIPILAQHFLVEFWKKHRNNDLTTVPTLTPATIEALQRRPWMGNVRELQNVMEHAVVLLEPGLRRRARRHPHHGRRGRGTRPGRRGLRISRKPLRPAVPPGEGAGDHRVRAALPLGSRPEGRREHVPGCPSRGGGPDHPLPPHAEAPRLREEILGD